MKKLMIITALVSTLAAGSVFAQSGPQALLYFNSATGLGANTDFQNHTTITSSSGNLGGITSVTSSNAGGPGVSVPADNTVLTFNYQGLVSQQVTKVAVSSLVNTAGTKIDLDYKLLSHGCSNGAGIALTKSTDTDPVILCAHPHS